MALLKECIFPGSAVAINISPLRGEVVCEVSNMNPKSFLQTIGSALSILMLLSTSEQAAPVRNEPPVTTVFAVLLKRVETKSASLNQEVTLRTVSDVVVDKIVVIPAGSSVVGRV